MIRKMDSSDLESLKAIRAEMLRLCPESFGADFEEKGASPDNGYLEWLNRGAMFGSFNEGRLVGLAGFFKDKHPRSDHRGMMFSVYVNKEYRGRGLAAALVSAVLDYARPIVRQVHCHVVTTAETAIKLYEKQGFKVYGTEPQSILVGDVFFDRLLMAHIFQ